MRDSSSRLGPIMEGSPRLAAMQASKSLPSSSRTWFSTGINKAGFFVVILFAKLLSRFFKQPPLYLPYLEIIGYDCDDWSISSKPIIEPQYSSVVYTEPPEKKKHGCSAVGQRHY